ncbi:MAG: hypothetical protein IK020_00360 [Clostridiales bacterium]|nr:hypothetical protein [Clostridiales bacterium]
MKHRILCILLASAMAASMMAGCSKSEETKKKTKKVKKTTAQMEESEEDPSVDPGNGLPEDPSDPSRSGYGSVSDLPADRVLFTFERSNCAWGYSSYTIAIMADGRVYIFDNHQVVNTHGEPYDFVSSLRFRLDCYKQVEPAGSVDEEWLQRMYELGSQVDPDAPFTQESAMCDYGQEALYYWDEKGDRVRLFEVGDWTYTIDDAYAQKSEMMWEEIDKHVTVNPDYQDLNIYTNMEMPMETYHCGYVDLPDGSSGKYFFENYEEFRKVAEEWHLDMQTIEEDLFANEYLQARPVFVQFDLFSTMGYTREYDALVIDNGTLYLMPSDTCTDPDSGDTVGQAMDGYVTIFLYSGELDITNPSVPGIGGQNWEKYQI